MSIAKVISRAGNLFGLLALLAILLFLLAFLAPFSYINCRTEDVDIRSGRTRYTRLFFWWPVSQRIEATPVSEVLGASRDEAEWCPVNTFSPPGASQSPQHSYHGAFAQISLLNAVWDVGQFTPRARQETAALLLRAWQRGGNYRAAGPYLIALTELTQRRSSEQPQRPIDTEDLPHDDVRN
jgi:hypothetical protein